LVGDGRERFSDRIRESDGLQHNRSQFREDRRLAIRPEVGLVADALS
jgi:hypothetical protein